jgi:uncharacterized caspase-like protein
MSRSSKVVLPDMHPPLELPGPRLALVVATAAYKDNAFNQLRAPAQDAADVIDVLAAPSIGGFTVTSAVDQPEHELRRRIGVFLAERSVNDLTVVYLSCHGVLDGRGRLYFATTDTVKSQLSSTAIDSIWLLDRLDECRARKQVVILDCCFSGAFARTKGDTDLHLDRRLIGAGRGRAVLTASRASEYSYEGAKPPTGARPQGSVFTAAFVDGLRSGYADRDNDGFISVEEAFIYAADKVKAAGNEQTPQRWLYGGEGQIILARSPRRVRTIATAQADQDDTNGDLEVAVTNSPHLVEAIGPAGRLMRRIPYNGIARVCLLIALAVLAVIATVVSLPIDFGWPSSVQRLARFLVGAGVLVGALGTLTGQSVRRVAGRLRIWLKKQRWPVRALAAVMSVLLLVAIAVIVVGLRWPRHPPASRPAVLQAPVEVSLGASVVPWRLHQDSSGAVWFIDEQEPRDEANDELGRISDGRTSIGVRLPAEDTELGELLSIQDFVTVGTDAWAIVRGFKQRVAVFDSAGRTVKVLPIDGAQAIETDAHGQVWIAAATGIGHKQAYLLSINSATGASVKHPFPATAEIDNIEFHFDAAGSTAWALTTSLGNPGVDIWTLGTDGTIRPFVYKRPTLWYQFIGAVAFAVDRLGVLWIPAGPDIVTISPSGTSRFLHLGGAQFIEDLVPAPQSGVVALVLTDSVLAGNSVAPLRNYLVNVQSPDSRTLPAYLRLPEPVWIEGVAAGRPAVIVGTEQDLLVTLPGRHSIFRFPQNLLTPSAVNCGNATPDVDRVTRAALPPPWTKADIESKPQSISAAEWRTILTGDAQLAAEATPNLDHIAARLPGQLDVAVDNFREAMRLQQAAIKARLAEPDTLDDKHAVASFRVRLMGDTLVAANGVRELCGLPRLDFDRNDVWGDSRQPTVQ